MSRPAGSTRNGKTALVLAGVAAGMVGLAFASVPLYQLFCQVTGFGGTTQRAESPPAQAGVIASNRVITVRFNADTAGSLPWQFRPQQTAVRVKVGEESLAFYEARNTSKAPVTGTATFNVTPLKAGQYFVKVECFCFTEQRLAPGKSIDMPVSFYIDPAILKDRNLDDVKTITLSYTFYRAEDDGKKPVGETAKAGKAGAAKK